ncbi:MAG TPA: HepT-like ribonuclease domain-containing protein [Solirubrobacteraceae bacterium]|nr:HepT-like ribonuclease domain-containing protein [Solirubrobacteraceae bacterium]
MSKSTRPPVTREARRKAVEQALAQLARTMEQLEIAVSSFPPNFDRESFGAAWYSHAPEERNRAMLVRSNMDDLHNLCQGLIDRSVRVAQDLGAIPADRKTPAVDQLRRLGLYPSDVRLVMQEVVDLRNASQHEYWILEPDVVHAAVESQRQHLPAFIAALGEWVEGILDQ